MSTPIVISPNVHFSVLLVHVAPLRVVTRSDVNTPIVGCALNQSPRNYAPFELCGLAFLVWYFSTYNCRKRRKYEEYMMRPADGRKSRPYKLA